MFYLPALTNTGLNLDELVNCLGNYAFNAGTNAAYRKRFMIDSSPNFKEVNVKALLKNARIWVKHWGGFIAESFQLIYAASKGPLFRSPISGIDYSPGWKKWALWEALRKSAGINGGNLLRQERMKGHQRDRKRGYFGKWMHPRQGEWMSFIKEYVRDTKGGPLARPPGGRGE